MKYKAFSDYVRKNGMDVFQDGVATKQIFLAGSLRHSQLYHTIVEFINAGYQWSYSFSEKEGKEINEHIRKGDAKYEGRIILTAECLEEGMGYEFKYIWRKEMQYDMSLIFILILLGDMETEEIESGENGEGWREGEGDTGETD